MTTLPDLSVKSVRGGLRSQFQAVRVSPGQVEHTDSCWPSSGSKDFDIGSVGRDKRRGAVVGDSQSNRIGAGKSCAHANIAIAR